jgi:hypothetical protein
MPSPSWLLLAWVGLAATSAAAVAGSLLGGRAPWSWALHAAPRSRAHAAGITILLGIVAYAAGYGILFELVGRSDLPFGLLAGLVHGAVAFLLSSPRRQPGAALRVWVMHAVYGGAAAFLYVTP